MRNTTGTFDFYSKPFRESVRRYNELERGEDRGTLRERFSTVQYLVISTQLQTFKNQRDLEEGQECFRLMYRQNPRM